VGRRAREGRRARAARWLAACDAPPPPARPPDAYTARGDAPGAGTRAAGSRPPPLPVGGVAQHSRRAPSRRPLPPAPRPRLRPTPSVVAARDAPDAPRRLRAQSARHARARRATPPGRRRRARRAAPSGPPPAGARRRPPPAPRPGARRGVDRRGARAGPFRPRLPARPPHGRAPARPRSETVSLGRVCRGPGRGPRLSRGPALLYGGYRLWAGAGKGGQAAAQDGGAAAGEERRGWGGGVVRGGAGAPPGAARPPEAR